MSGARSRSNNDTKSSSTNIMKTMNMGAWQELHEIVNTLDWITRIDIAYTIAELLAMMHARRESPQDLSINSILISRHTHSKISFGISKTTHDKKQDIYYFGMLVIDLTSAQGHLDNDAKQVPPKKTDSFNKDNWIKQVRNQMPFELREPFLLMILNCVSKEPKKRPSASHLARALKCMSIILNTAKKRDANEKMTMQSTQLSNASAPLTNQSNNPLPSTAAKPS